MSPPSPRPAERLCKRPANLVLLTAWEGPVLPLLLLLQSRRGGVVILQHPGRGWGEVAFLGARKETPQVMSAEASLLKGCFQFPLLSGPGVSQASVNSGREAEPQLVHLQGTWATTGAASGLKEELDLHSVH